MAKRKRKSVPLVNRVADLEMQVWRQQMEIAECRRQEDRCERDLAAARSMLASTTNLLHESNRRLALLRRIARCEPVNEGEPDAVSRHP